MTRRRIREGEIEYRGWVPIGGTSVASPIVASTFALAGGAGARAGGKAVAYPAQTLYENLTADPAALHDVTVRVQRRLCQRVRRTDRRIGMLAGRRGRLVLGNARSALPVRATTVPPASAPPTGSRRSSRPTEPGTEGESEGSSQGGGGSKGTEGGGSKGGGRRTQRWKRRRRKRHGGEDRGDTEEPGVASPAAAVLPSGWTACDHGVEPAPPDPVGARAYKNRHRGAEPRQAAGVAGRVCVHAERGGARARHARQAGHRAWACPLADAALLTHARRSGGTQQRASERTRSARPGTLSVDASAGARSEPRRSRSGSADAAPEALLYPALDALAVLGQAPRVGGPARGALAQVGDHSAAL